MTKVFISYSHDSDPHRDFVRGLSDRLRTEGLECLIDQYVNGFPPEGWQCWMENQIELADFVLLVCTETYLRRYRKQETAGGHGVTFEGVVISQTLYDHYYHNTKFIPVIPAHGLFAHVPIPLKQYSTYRLPEDYETLYRLLTGQARFVPPEMGEIRPPSLLSRLFGGKPSAPARVAKLAHTMDQQFDIFLSHNSKDKAVIRDIKQWLVARQLSVWLDEDELQPGVNWTPLLEKAICICKSAGAFVGSSGIGPWEDEEIQSLLSEAVRNKTPVILVLLPGDYQEPKLPLFLRNRTYIDMRSGITPELIDKLVWGITGKKPTLVSSGSIAPVPTPTPNSSIPSRGMQSINDERRARLHEKLRRLYESYDLETRVDEKMRIKAIIDQTEADLQGL